MRHYHSEDYNGQSRFATPRYFEKYADVCQPNYMVGAPCICMAEPEAFQDELIGHIKYMGTPPGPSREVRLRRAPPAAQTPAGGARGGMLSMEAGRARCRPRGPRTQPAPAMWRSTCISYGVRPFPPGPVGSRSPHTKYKSSQQRTPPGI